MKPKVLGYGYLLSKENIKGVLKCFYGLNFHCLAMSSKELDRQIRIDKVNGNFGKTAKPKRFRVIIEEIK